MTQLTRSWLVMSMVVITVALVLAVAPGLPRPVWLVLIMAASFVKARLVLLDYLELRHADEWRVGAMAALVALLLVMAALAAMA
jgi:heme/copper-type cytochrome/quinol oxidase subunit 4